VSEICGKHRYYCGTGVSSLTKFHGAELDDPELWWSIPAIWSNLKWLVCDGVLEDVVPHILQVCKSLEEMDLTIYVPSVTENAGVAWRCRQRQCDSILTGYVAPHAGDEDNGRRKTGIQDLPGITLSEYAT